MTPEQWARVLKAGYEQLGFNSSTLSPANALGMALEAMSDECLIISKELKQPRSYTLVDHE